ncbi:hypothetical protein MAUB1S_00302 [Mycolicibacterium aubagnense]
MTVVIAGAGPTGLTLAIELARRGVACRVLDRAPTLFPGSRGKGLQPRTHEVFDDLGVIGAVLAAGEAFPPMRLYRGAEVVWTKPIYELLGLPDVVATPAVTSVTGVVRSRAVGTRQACSGPAIARPTPCCRMVADCSTCSADRTGRCSTSVVPQSISVSRSCA